MASPTLNIVRTHGDRSVPVAGRYAIDSAHTSVEFTARHLMISKVRGRITDVSGTIVVGEDPEASLVDAVLSVASLDTGNAQRDRHLRSADFFDVDTYPQMTFRSTSVQRGAKDVWLVVGNLTIRDITHEVVLPVRFNGANSAPTGEARVAFSAVVEVDREEWGLTWNQALETGGVLIGSLIRVSLDVEAVAEGVASSEEER